MRDSETQNRLRSLPGVDRLLVAAQQEPQLAGIAKTVLVRAIRETIDNLRHLILSEPGRVSSQTLSHQALIQQIIRRVDRLQQFNLQRTINAAGVVVHTNLGRSCLASAAVEHVAIIGAHYSNLEFDLQQGRRGSRYSAVESLLCELSRAEAALAVNNNAAAVLLCLDTLARHKEVIISRGELIEIGGSFRIPDVMAKSGALLKEVGTTNRTHPRDYEQAISAQTGLLLKVHTSNYSIVGFTAAVPVSQLADLGQKYNLPVMEDLGSGNFIDFTRYGLPSEPTVQDSVKSGADVVTFSGDKLLGGPQAGLIVGKREIIDRVKSNPLTRALRIDKMTLAALEATLRLYRDEPRAIAQIPTLRMLTEPLASVERRAAMLTKALGALGDRRMQVDTYPLPSRAGGGSLPMLELPSCCVGLRFSDRSAHAMEKALRGNRPPVIARIENDLLILDPRTIEEQEVSLIAEAIQCILKTTRSSATDQETPNGDCNRHQA